MADLGGDWSAKANVALSISLVTPATGGSKTISTFHPRFTYTMFGDEESIFGYQGLKIHLRYHACDMRPGLQITYNKKFKAVGDTSATDIKAVLEENLLPQAAFDKTSAFDASINDAMYKNWKPPGELLKSIQADDKSYEVWKASLADKTVQQLMKRIRILIPLYIEGGQALYLEDPEWSLRRWTVFFLYQKKPTNESNISPYVFTGFATVYHYFHYPLPTPQSSPTSKGSAVTTISSEPFEFPVRDAHITDFPRRSRISQFLILPPFQGGGNGSRLYDTIYSHYLQSKQTVEITVEDPNESFDDLRDLNDLSHLRSQTEFTSLRIKTNVRIAKKGRVPTGKIVDLDAIETLRKKNKIALRQFMRVVEMQLLSLIPTYIRKSLLHEPKRGTPSEIREKEHEYHLWQLFVKQRLYRHNKDSLMQLDRAERIDKLDDALGNVEADYARLLRALDQKRGGKAMKKSGEGAEGSAKRTAEGESNGEPSTKKVKMTEQ